MADLIPLHSAFGDRLGEYEESELRPLIRNHQAHVVRSADRTIRRVVLTEADGAFHAALDLRSAGRGALGGLRSTYKQIISDHLPPILAMKRVTVHGSLVCSSDM